MIFYIVSNASSRCSITSPNQRIQTRVSVSSFDCDKFHLCLLSSAESEKALQDSKVRDHVREMLKHLQQEDELWVNSHLQKTDDEVRDHPCLEVFLQNHIMEELCTRANKDRPRWVPCPAPLPLSMLWQWLSYIGAGNHHNNLEEPALPAPPSPNRPQGSLPIDRQRRGALSEVHCHDEIGA
jgi:hypothetical protein